MTDVLEAGGRKRAIEAFACAEPAALAKAWEKLGSRLHAQILRGPEVGLVMLRGRIGGGGAAFNLGEASVTRASVQLADGTVGHAMVLGRDTEKARLAACLDAVWQLEAHRSLVENEVIAPALAAKTERDRVRAEETAATRVDFFTLVRGDD